MERSGRPRPKIDTHARGALRKVRRFILSNGAVGFVKTIRIPLHVLYEDDVAQLLDVVTDVDGVVAALLDESDASLQVVVRSDASALHVREQLSILVHAAASA